MEQSKEIYEPKLSDKDIYVLEKVERDTLKEIIDFLRGYKEVSLYDGDGVTLSARCFALLLLCRNYYESYRNKKTLSLLFGASYEIM